MTTTEIKAEFLEHHENIVNNMFEVDTIEQAYSEMYDWLTTTLEAVRTEAIRDCIKICEKKIIDSKQFGNGKENQLIMVGENNLMFLLENHLQQLLKGDMK